MSEYVTPSQFHDAEGTKDWRLTGEGACAYFPTGSLAAGARFALAISELDGIANHQPDIDLRHDGVTVRLLTVSEEWFGPSQRDVELARRVSAVAHEHGLKADPTKVQSLLIIPGAPRPAEIMPFWQAILGYEPRQDSPTEDLIDPRWRGTPLWFEQMDEPRADGGGAIHIAVWVPEEQAEARVASALAAGGRVVRDDYAPSWWTLADAYGNECDVASTKGRE